MALTDVVIEVCDARLPEASSNPMIRELRLHRQRPLPQAAEQGRSGRPGGDPGLAGFLQQPARGSRRLRYPARNRAKRRRVPGL